MRTHTHTHTPQGCSEERPREDIARRRPPTSHREVRMKPTLPTPGSWTSGFQNYEKISFSCVSHAVCDVLLWQPQKTNTPAEPQNSPFEIGMDSPSSKVCFLRGLHAPGLISHRPPRGLHPPPPNSLQLPECVLFPGPSPCICCILCWKAHSPTWKLLCLLRDSFPASPPLTSLIGALSRALVEVTC